MIDYQQVLADLEARRDALVADLEASIRTIKQILRQGEGRQSKPDEFPLRKSGSVNNTTLVLEFLTREAPRAHTSQEISEAVGLEDKPVRGILMRLHRGKKIDKPSRGKYRGKPQPQAAEA